MSAARPESKIAIFCTKKKTGVRSTNRSFLNFFANTKFPDDVLADLTPIFTVHDRSKA